MIPALEEQRASATARVEERNRLKGLVDRIDGTAHICLVITL